MHSHTVEIDAGKFEGLFRASFGSALSPVIVRSPGRVNLIGEHTDYNEGFVLPGAVDKAIYLAVSARSDTKIRIFSIDMNEWFEGTITELKYSERRWPNYMLGVVDQLIKANYEFSGFNCLFGGDIPIGAGMSSSAAIECGLIFALNEVFGFRIDKLTLVRMAQKAENEFVGVQCGIMDQFVNIFGENKTVLRIDCRSLEYDRIPFERTDLSIVLCETEKRRELASSEYNVRRLQCEEGVRILSEGGSRITRLRDVSVEMLERHRQQLPSVVFRRCLYVIKENNRVLAACDDLYENDFTAFGKKMFESHEGLSRDYEVSSAELDALVAAASGMKGVLGSRMMGAGFGGCTISLVEEEYVEHFTTMIQEQHLKETNKAIQVHIAKLKAGTQLIN
jgi:galactokinase